MTEEKLDEEERLYINDIEMDSIVRKNQLKKVIKYKWKAVRI